MGSVSRRLLASAAVPMLAVFLVAFAWAGVASAHHVSGIDVTCDYATANFAQFPSEGVSVHIAAAVEGHGTLASEVLVHDDMSAQLDISSTTSALAGATANVDVDVTWMFEGPQHVHDTFSLTCGSSTTTTVHHCGCGSTTTTVGEVTSTTAAAEVTTTTVATAGSTSTTGGQNHPATSTTAVTVLGIETGSGTPTGGTPSTGVLSETASNGAISPTGASETSGTLPFTGGMTLPLLIVGIASLGAGVAAVIRSRAHRRLTDY